MASAYADAGQDLVDASAAPLTILAATVIRPRRRSRQNRTRSSSAFSRFIYGIGLCALAVMRAIISISTHVSRQMRFRSPISAARSPRRHAPTMAPVAILVKSLYRLAQKNAPADGLLRDDALRRCGFDK